MEIALGKGHFHTRGPEIALDPASEFAPDLPGIRRAGEFEPVVDAEAEGAVPECFKKDARGGLPENLRLPFQCRIQEAHDFFNRRAVGDSDRKIEPVVRVGKRPVRHLLLQKCAVGNQQFHTIKFTDPRAPAAQVRDFARASCDLDDVADFNLTLKQ